MSMREEDRSRLRQTKRDLEQVHFPPSHELGPSLSCLRAASLTLVDRALQDEYDDQLWKEFMGRLGWVLARISTIVAIAAGGLTVAQMIGWW